MTKYSPHSQEEEGRDIFNPDPIGVELLCWRLGSIGRATTLAFAAVLAFASVVASLAAAFAFTRVLPLAGVLFVFLVLAFFPALSAVILLSGTHAAALSLVLALRVKFNAGSRHQAGQCGARQQSLQ
jgi:hypothetical protein